ncbi:MAG: hypothetical protein K2O24_06025 [Muribaculaceae bacterium]|nr:hypothetical protein [Muribaculaceae bacterium]
MSLTYRSLLALLASLLMLAAGGCTAGEENEPESDGLPVEIRLSVSLASQCRGKGEVTRAPAAPDYELPDYDTETLSRLRVIIVDGKTGRVTHNRSVAFKNGLPVEDDLKFTGVENRGYRIFLIGNEQSIYYNFTQPALAPGAVYVPGTLENILITRDLDEPLFDNTIPFLGKKSIPMAECFEIRTSKALEAGSSENFNLVLTRAAVKFSFSVTTSEDFTDGSGRKITSIGISDIADREYLFPRNAMYEPGKYNPSTNLYEGREIVKFDVPEKTKTGEYVYHLPVPVDLPVSDFRYAPEIYLPESAQPADGFKCTLSFDNGESWLIPVTLPNLPYGLPRNTHVKVNITLGNDNFAILTVKVLPWTTEVSRFEYSDFVSLASDGAFNVTGTTSGDLNKFISENFDLHTGRMVVRYPYTVSGTFGISTPEGARWDAYLVTTSGVQDAIRFVTADDNGNEIMTTHISGMVGSLAVFTFGPFEGAGLDPNVAELVVTVTMPDGRTLPVNIMQGVTTGTADVLTIIQNPQY